MSSRHGFLVAALVLDRAVVLSGALVLRGTLVLESQCHSRGRRHQPVDPGQSARGHDAGRMMRPLETREVPDGVGARRDEDAGPFQQCEHRRIGGILRVVHRPGGERRPVGPPRTGPRTVRSAVLSTVRSSVAARMGACSAARVPSSDTVSASPSASYGTVILSRSSRPISCATGRDRSSGRSR